MADTSWSAMLAALPEGDAVATSSGDVTPSAGKSDGGEAKLVRLCCLSYADCANSCLGLIGGGQHFCLKKKAEGEEHCGTSHRGGSFIADEATFYIKSTSTVAFTAPSLPVSRVEEKVAVRFLADHRTIAAWASVFTLFDRDGTPSGETTVTRRLEFLEKERQLKTPVKAVRSPGEDWEDTGLVPSLTFEPSADDRARWERAYSEPGFVEFLWSLEDGLTNVMDQIPGIHRDLEGNVRTIRDDLEALEAYGKATSQRVGAEIRLGSDDYPTVAAAISSLKSELDNQDEEQGDKWQVMEDELQKAKQASEDNVAMLEVARKTVTVMFDRLRQAETAIKRLDESVKTVERTRVTHGSGPSDRPSRVGDGWASLIERAGAPGRTVADPTPEPTRLSAQVKELSDSVRNLELQMEQKGVEVGGVGVRSHHDMAAWVTTHLPEHRFGLFLDAVSILEFLFYGSVSMDGNMKSQDHSEKLGFETLYEARVCTSFQNRLPNVLGSIDDKAFPLSKLSTYEKWDSGDHMGLRYQLKNEIPSIRKQVKAAINSALTDPEAKSLALECLSTTDAFITEMSNYVSQTYRDLVDQGGFVPKDAWRLVCKLLRRIFEDLSDVRLCGRDAKMKGNPTHTTAMFLWGTLQAQVKMQSYIVYNFEAHPALTAEYTTFLAHHSPFSVISSLTDKVTRLEGDLASLKTAKTANASKVDQILSRLDGVEKKLKAKN